MAFGTIPFFPPPVTSASSPRSSNGRRSWVWESGSRSPGHWARRAGSALRFQYPVARNPSPRSRRCRPSVRPWPAISNTPIPHERADRRLQRGRGPARHQSSYPPLPDAQARHRLAKLPGQGQRLNRIGQSVPSPTPGTRTVPAIATAQPHASEAHLVSLNSKAFSGSALTVAVSLELSSSRYLAEKGRLEDLPGRFGKLDSLISMRTL